MEYNKRDQRSFKTLPTKIIKNDNILVEDAQDISMNLIVFLSM